MHMLEDLHNILKDISESQFYVSQTTFLVVQLKCRAVVKGGEGFPLGYCDPCLLSLKIDEKWNQMATWLEIHHF